MGKSEEKNLKGWLRHHLRRQKTPKLYRGQEKFSAVYADYSVGIGTYGIPHVHDWHEGSTLRIGAYTSMETEDVLIFTGGASVGEKDYLKQALDDLGEIEHWKMAIKPGKPFGWGKVGTGTKVFLLPGNPVASYATSLLLAIPAMKRIAGVSIEKSQPVSFKARADFDVPNNKSIRRDFRRAIIKNDEHGAWAELLTTQDSHMLSGISYGDVLVEVPTAQSIKRGDLLNVYPLIGTHD